VTSVEVERPSGLSYKERQFINYWTHTINFYK